MKAATDMGQRAICSFETSPLFINDVSLQTFHIINALNPFANQNHYLKHKQFPKQMSQIIICAEITKCITVK